MNWLTPTILPISFVLVGVYRLCALRWHWMDKPNQRSSHQGLIPRGAGIVFALLITGAALWIPAQPDFSVSFVAVFAVALIGWWDDLRGVSARYRLALYWISAICVVMGVYAALINTTSVYPAAFVLIVLAVSLPLVWLTNLYNFMDGINGIAGFEAVFVLGAMLWLGADTAFNHQFTQLLWIALFAVAGFLLWNFPVAKVFMGDAGSAYLGSLMGFFTVCSTQMGGPSLYSWLILLGVFVVDTGYTLIVRAATGQRWYLAHRMHAYQRLSDRLHSHTRAVLFVAAINLFWLLPCAWLARHGGWTGFSAMAFVYAPLLAGCYWLKAGVPTCTKV